MAATIREFRPGDEEAFRKLNEEWISRYFVIEEKDEACFADPRKTILDGGGKIFMAVQGEQPVGCCALLATAPGEFEIVKMGVTETSQRGGIGKQLLRRVIQEGFALGAHRLYLETNRRLAGAIRLYEAHGFRHVPAERLVPSPYTRANVFMELYRRDDSTALSDD